MSNSIKTIQAGMVIGARYVLRTQIAVGGMGEVWRATDILTNQPVAVKVLKVELSGQEQFLARLRLEAANAQRINHPNLAAVIDSGQQDGLGWLAMELVEGEPLSQRLRGGRVMQPAEVLPIIYLTALALQAVHDAGVVHRDIKPGNILLPDGSVKLTDFGISKTASQETLTQAGMVMGTAQYLPPEQAVGQEATSHGDLYALGVIFYEALAGRRPFTGNSQVDIAFAHVNSPVPELPEEIAPQLRELVMELLVKDPQARLQTAAELARRLETIDEELGLHCLPTVLDNPNSTGEITTESTPATPPAADSDTGTVANHATEPDQAPSFPASDATHSDSDDTDNTATNASDAAETEITGLAGGMVPAPPTMPPSIRPGQVVPTLPPAPQPPTLPAAAVPKPRTPSDIKQKPEPATPVAGIKLGPTVLTDPDTARAPMTERIREWVSVTPRPRAHEREPQGFASALLVIVLAVVLLCVALTIATFTGTATSSNAAATATAKTPVSLLTAGGTISCQQRF